MRKGRQVQGRGGAALPATGIWNPDLPIAARREQGGKRRSEEDQGNQGDQHWAVAVQIRVGTWCYHDC
ncbi:MAG TPA: hypothetical protein VGU90_04395 [Terriglobales bacterium]|nr:hypothetical protein [Terriglobales bacterium]